MRFGLTSIFYAIAVIAAAIGTFGPWGLIPAALVLAFWGSVFESRKAAAYIFLGLLLTVFVADRRVSSRRDSCLNNMRQLTLALLGYAAEHGSFPPAYVADETGRPMHSWRILILPYVGRPDLYDKYDFDEPWDGPNNRKLADQMPLIYRCPAQHNPQSPNATAYVAIVGPNTMWPGSKPRRLKTVSDERSDTLMLVELKDSNINWMEPRDFTIEELLKRNAAGEHSASPCIHYTETRFFHQCGWNGAFADGHAQFLDHFISRQTLRALATVDGGEEVSAEAARAVRRPNWGPVISALLFVTFALLPVVPLLKRRIDCRRNARGAIVELTAARQSRNQTLECGDSSPLWISFVPFGGFHVRLLSGRHPKKKATTSRSTPKSLPARRL